MKTFSSRIVLITDGQNECPVNEVAQTIERSKFKDRVKVDVIAVGMKPATQELYSSLAKITGGQFLKVDRPEDVQPALAPYQAVLQTAVPEPIQVAGEGANYSILPGEKAKLAPRFLHHNLA